ncbi:MAG: metalloprotease [Pirellulaceae bacterium]|nr:MAG: metalloprotease [Pirellulaceae bacterium]
MDGMLIFADWVNLALLATIAKVVIGIGLVIFVHELGHFLAAKAVGVKCERFYVGFDLPRWSLFGIPMPSRIARFQWGETEYGIGIIPLGGYVKMLGQDDNPTRAEQEAQRTRVETVGPDGTVQLALDPRSYPAKSVPARMLIISAGILMNLVFAVLFAAWAYRLGIWYLPSEIGNTLPGDPGWVAGWQPGDTILQVGKEGRPNPHLRFDKDLRYQVFLRGISSNGREPIDVLVRHRDGHEKWYSIVPRMRGERGRLATLGISSTHATTLARSRPTLDYLAAGRATPPLEPGDRIVGVDGQMFSEKSANSRGELPAYELLQYLATHRDREVELLVERSTTNGVERLPVRLPPQPMRGVGLQMTLGAVAAVQADSPAARAGLQPGDLVRSINGQPVGDPMTLAERFENLSAPVRLRVLRPKNSDGEVSSSPDASESHSSDEIDLVIRPDTSKVTIPIYTEGGRVAVNQWGVAFEVLPTVSSVTDPKAIEAGLDVGSRVQAVRPVAASPEAHQRALEWLAAEYDTQITLSDELNWVYVHGMIQQLPPDIHLQVTAENSNGKLVTVVLPVRDLPGVYAVDRGLVLKAFERLHRAGSWWEAAQLGWRETWERLGEVAAVLRLLVQGRLAMDNLAGPVRIAAFAGQEAAKGWPALLMFLTLLSANLALLNALPIPVLDGGHMMFLVAEAVLRRPVPEKWQGILSLLGFACLLALLVYVSTNDVRWLFRWF